MKIFAPKFWNRLGIIPLLLMPFTFIYISVFYLRKILIKEHKFNLKVITIGNIDVGGSGKTPVAIYTASILNKIEPNFCFLSKGYKGKACAPQLVSLSDDPSHVGDEPLLLAKYGRVVVAKNRQEGLKFCESLGVAVVITDDGLQNPSFYKDLKIIVVDGNYGFGNYLPIPSGPMREFARFVLSASDMIINLNAPPSAYLLHYKNKLINGKFLAQDNHNEGLFIAIAGIGRPEKFFNFLKDLSYHVVMQIKFPDHHPYNKDEILNLIEKAKNHSAKIITTEKDIVKIRNLINDVLLNQYFVSLKITLKLENETSFNQKITSIF